MLIAFFNTYHFNIILPPTPTFPKQSVPFSSSDQNFLCITNSFHECSMFCQSQNRNAKSRVREYSDNRLPKHRSRNNPRNVASIYYKHIFRNRYLQRKRDVKHQPLSDNLKVSAAVHHATSPANTTSDHWQRT